MDLSYSSCPIEIRKFMVQNFAIKDTFWELERIGRSPWILWRKCIFCDHQECWKHINFCLTSDWLILFLNFSNFFTDRDFVTHVKQMWYKPYNQLLICSKGNRKHKISDKYIKVIMLSTSLHLLLYIRLNRRNSLCIMFWHPFHPWPTIQIEQNIIILFKYMQ